MKKTVKHNRNKIVQKYFNTNNYGFETPELNYSRYRIYTMFDKRSEDLSKFYEMLLKNEKHINHLLSSVSKYEVSFSESEFTEESIKSELDYMSDRWYCYHRLLFLSELIKRIKGK